MNHREALSRGCSFTAKHKNEKYSLCGRYENSWSTNNRSPDGSAEHQRYLKIEFLSTIFLTIETAGRILHNCSDLRRDALQQHTVPYLENIRTMIRS